jgi:phospholipid transport system substrate-binding protein
MFLPSISSSAALPDLVVSQTIDEVMRILSTDSLKGAEHKAERRIKIRIAISKGFNFEAMAKRAMGKYWKQRTPEERKQFTILFRRLIEISYISRIEGFTNEKVIYEKARTQKNISMVKTKIVMTKGTEIPINYRLMKKNGSWRIYDIVIEGVSLVRNYRTQFSSVLRKKSYSILVDQIKAKIEKSK